MFQKKKKSQNTRERERGGGMPFLYRSKDVKINIFTPAEIHDEPRIL